MNDHKRQKRSHPKKANIHWLAVTDKDLRCHPFYFSLPDVNTITNIQSFQDLRRFPQDSVQWDLMHVGRLTTSRASGALGIHESLAGTYLNLPRGFIGQSKAQDAFSHLLEKPLFNTLEGARNVLLRASEFSISTQNSKKQRIEEVWRVWSRNNVFSNSSIWALEYTRLLDPKEVCGTDSGLGSIRMAWGGVHEATALLVVLNYFYITAGAQLNECGMHPSEALLEMIPMSGVERRHHQLLREMHGVGLRIGASPDGVLCYPNGMVETVEVKNHAPFGWMNGSITYQDREPGNEIFASWVPQIQLEMFCVGPKCRSSVLVRLTATKGAVIMRIRRDDDYITLMLNQFLAFHRNYVRPGRPPPEDFSSKGRDAKLCQDILKRTKEIADKAELVARLQPWQIQRAKPDNLPLLV